MFQNKVLEYIILYFANGKMHVFLCMYLELVRTCRRGEVEGSAEMSLWTSFLHVGFHHDSLGAALLADEQYSFLLLRDSVDQVVNAHVVQNRHQDTAVIWCSGLRVNVICHHRSPQLPLSWSHQFKKC